MFSFDEVTTLVTSKLWWRHRHYYKEVKLLEKSVFLNHTITVIVCMLVLSRLDYIVLCDIFNKFLFRNSTTQINTINILAAKATMS